MRRGSISSELLMWYALYVVIALLARCIETIDVCIWFMFDLCPL